MTICPWCGTQHPVFQSNCKNCGGPMQAPDLRATFEERDEAIQPPAAPRPISNRYVWRIMLTDAWSIAAFVFALLGIIFLPLGFGLTLGVITAFVGIPFLLIGAVIFFGGIGVLAWRYTEANKIVEVIRSGEAVLGQINDLQLNPSVTINGRNPWVISYRFNANGQAYDGKMTTLNPPARYLQPGRAVSILYLATDPRYSAIYPHP